MENLLNALDLFKERKTLVIGDILLDYSIEGSAERLNPEIPAVPLIKVRDTDYRLGGAGNVARNLASLGAGCCLFGQIGRDAGGEKIRELCDKERIRTYLVDSGRETPVKQRLFSDGHYIVRVDFGENNLEPISPELERDLAEEVIKTINLYDLVIFSDYDKGIFRRDLAKRVIEASKEKGILTLADPKPRNIYSFQGCDIIRPNRKEAEEITGMRYNGKNLGEIARNLAERTKSKYEVITCGDDGAFAYHAESNISTIIPVKKVEIGDATGAGDTFAAVLGLGIAPGFNFEMAVRAANYASALVVDKAGTAVTNVSELQNALDEIVSYPEIMSLR